MVLCLVARGGRAAVALGTLLASLVIAFPVSAIAETVDADIDGDGAAEAVTVNLDDFRGWVDVTPSGSGTPIRYALAVGQGLFEPLVRLRRNVDGRPGEELLIHVHHISTYDAYAFVSHVDGQLRATSRVLADSWLGDGHAMGFRCGQVSGRAGVSTYEFGQLGSRKWQRRSRRYQWLHGRLKQIGQSRRSVVKRPPGRERGIHC